MADVEKVVRNAIESKKAIIGSDRALGALKQGELSAIVVASNCPKDVEAKIAHYAAITKSEVHKFPGTSTELGAICRKPFSVLLLGVKA